MTDHARTCGNRGYGALGVCRIVHRMLFPMVCSLVSANVTRMRRRAG
jgi:hypothetical protein